MQIIQKERNEVSAPGFFTCDLLSLRLSYVNERFAAIFGLSRDKLYDHPATLLAILCTEDIHYLQSRHSELITTGGIHNAEFCFRLPGERLIYLHCDAFVTNATITGMVRDISGEDQHLQTDRESNTIALPKRRRTRVEIYNELHRFTEWASQQYSAVEFKVVFHQGHLPVNADSFALFRIMHHLVLLAIKLTGTTRIQLIIDPGTEQCCIHLKVDQFPGECLLPEHDLKAIRELACHANATIEHNMASAENFLSVSFQQTYKAVSGTVFDNANTVFEGTVPVFP